MPTKRRALAYRTTTPSRSLGLSLMSDRELLAMRLRDLGLRLPGSELERRTRFLDAELGQRGLAFRPHMWLSTEWFSPDDVPGFAIPFYLAHARLWALEAQQMRVVEGGTPRSFLQLMRHETGHALDSAYRLHERDEWRELFGPFNAPYVRHYQTRPHSKRFVRHLDNGYAQSHPAEDFAETLAVWLDPESGWRTRYRGWPAFEKLAYVDRTMREIARQTPLVRTRERVEPIDALSMTLGEYYEDKRRRYAVNRDRMYERDLRRLFPTRPAVLESRRRFAAAPGGGDLHAADYLRSIRPQLRKLVAERTGAFQYEIDRVLRDMVKRSAKLDLFVASAEARPDGRLARRIAAQLMRYMSYRHHLFAR
jgi:hypothetical protein